MKFFGARIKGKYSRRIFDSDKIGIPIRNLTIERIRITNRGIEVVEKHLKRFVGGLEKPEEIMIERLRRIVVGELKATRQDLNFYAHELREFVRYKNLGFIFGEPSNPTDAFELWQNAHTATLEDYKMKENRFSLRENPLYHAEAAWYIIREYEFE